MKKKLVTVFLLLIFICQFFGCNKESKVGSLIKVEDYDNPNTVIGVEVGTVSEFAIRKRCPNAKIVYVNDVSSGFLAVKTNQVNGYVACKSAIVSALKRGVEGLMYIDEELDTPGNLAVGISRVSKIEKKEELINTFITEMRDKGILDEMYERWVVDLNYTMPEIPEPKNPVRKINVGTTGLVEPYTFYQGSEVVGYDMELLKRFASWANFDVELSMYDWNSIVPALATGKIDYIFSNLMATEERGHAAIFSIPYGIVEPVLVIKKSSANSGKSYTELIYESFYSTFVREQRWKLILSGLFVTLCISVLSAIVGTILGFGICLARRSSRKIWQKLATLFAKLIQSIPLVVLLMLLYYVVFASTNLNGIIVAVIAFSINFGVGVSEMMRSGIDGVEKGQWEASTALGFNRYITFFKIVMPQAICNFLPSYKGEFVGMMKMTSIVGYITICDLTKASDIIRSRTFEAFFPLLTITVIYFILAWLLTWLIGLVEVAFNPKKRSVEIKGINKDIDLGQKIKSKISFNDEVVIHIEHLKKSYPNVTPLTDVNADIKQGEVVSIIGPSGTGKSTLLRMINQIEKQTDGEIVVFGQNMNDKKTDKGYVRRRMGMVFQSFNLFAHLTIIENIMIAPMWLLKLSKQEAYENAMHLLATVGLVNKAFSYPDELSGGQKQRVAIVRALAMKPEVILFDEPTSALDPTMVGEVLTVIRNLSKQGLTMIIVTHEMKFARDVSTRIFYMDEGVIYEDGTPKQIFENPQKEKTRQFVKRLRIFKYRIESLTFDFIELYTQIENFCNKHLFVQKTQDEIQCVVEELCVQILLPKLDKKDAMIDLEIEYSDINGEIKIEISYGGQKIDYLAVADPMPANLIKHAASDIKYFYDEKNKYVLILNKL